VNYTEILDALREFTSRERIELMPSASHERPVSDYAPIHKYVLDLKNIVKPETAAEDLFTALCKDVLGFQPTRQVGSREGWVDFMFFARCRQTGSVIDTLRRVEDTAEKPELERQFFDDLQIWFHEFDKVKWAPPELAAESIILLINKLIFARTIEDYGLVQL
jgi:hypothetical protein